MRRRAFLKAATALLLGGKFFLSLKGARAEASPMDPLLAPWTGEHGGFPRFDLIKIGDFKDALSKGMELERAEIDRIGAQSEAPTFENTIAAYQDSGRPLGRAQS